MDALRVKPAHGLFDRIGLPPNCESPVKHLWGWPWRSLLGVDEIATPVRGVDSCPQGHVTLLIKKGR